MFYVELCRYPVGDEKNVRVTKSLEVGKSGRLLAAFTLTAILALSIGS
jgi:hypothetical protein